MKTVFSFLIYVVFISNTYALPQCEGEDETKWQNCEGTLKFRDDEFVGVFNDGIFDGETESKIRYEGEYKNGTPHGQGTWTADVLKYVGEFKDGERHGEGTETLANGDKYVGYWREGKGFGPVTFIFASGGEIEGYWKDGEFVPK